MRGSDIDSGQLPAGDDDRRVVMVAKYRDTCPPPKISAYEASPRIVKLIAWLVLVFGVWYGSGGSWVYTALAVGCAAAWRMRRRWLWWKWWVGHPQRLERIDP